MPKKSADHGLPVVKVSRRGANRLEDGHVWVYRSDILDANGIGPGTLVGVADERGKFLGTALYSSASQIAIRMVTNPGHAALWADLPEKSAFNMLIEQFLLAACIDYHRVHPQSAFRGITIRYLFPSWEAAFNPQLAAQAGYTHLLGDAKSDPEVTARLERRVASLDPAFHRHCYRVAAAH